MQLHRVEPDLRRRHHAERRPRRRSRTSAPRPWTSARPGPTSCQRLRTGRTSSPTVSRPTTSLSAGPSAARERSGRGRPRARPRGASRSPIPGGSYPNSSSTFATLATPLDLRGHGACELRFRARFVMAAGDVFAVDRSVGGGAFQRIGSTSASGGSTGGSYGTFRSTCRRRTRRRSHPLRAGVQRARYRGRGQRRRRQPSAASGPRRGRAPSSSSTGPRWPRHTSPAPPRCCSAASRR